VVEEGRMGKTVNKVGKKTSIFDIILYLVMAVIIIITVYPFYSQVIISVSSTEDVYKTGLILWPSSIDFSGWKIMMGYRTIWGSYLNTVLRVLVGTSFSVLVTALFAYPLSKSYLPFRQFFTSLVFITMFFGGGLIPNYLLMKNLNLINSFWVMILPGLITGYNVFIMRNFFMGIPDSLEESAKIDGASDLLIFFKIIIPMSKPVLATVALWVGVGHWQEWFSNLLYIDDSKKWVIMMVARKILIDQDFGSMAEATRNLGMGILKGSSNEVQIRACVITATVLPMLFVYPFIQKYFVKGVNLGAIKG